MGSQTRNDLLVGLDLARKQAAGHNFTAGALTERIKWQIPD
jgi:hypothetical protein